jgi:hypothetical protein
VEDISKEKSKLLKHVGRYRWFGRLPGQAFVGIPEILKKLYV